MSPPLRSDLHILLVNPAPLQHTEESARPLFNRSETSFTPTVNRGAQHLLGETGALPTLTTSYELSLES